jgi:hypothetical protein
MGYVKKHPVSKLLNLLKLLYLNIVEITLFSQRQEELKPLIQLLPQFLGFINLEVFLGDRPPHGGYIDL